MTDSPLPVSMLLLAAPLQRFTQGAASVSASGTNLAEILENTKTRFPGLGEAIVKDGELVPFVTALLDGGTGDAISLTTPVPPGAAIRLLCAVAGG